MGGTESGQKIKLVFNVSPFVSILITLLRPKFQNSDLMETSFYTTETNAEYSLK